MEPATDHAGLYVALTRGRGSNIALVPVDGSKTQTPVDVLAGCCGVTGPTRPLTPK